jgi:tetratricopeptide (TPR) repeat protein
MMKIKHNVALLMIALFIAACGTLATLTPVSTPIEGTELTAEAYYREGMRLLVTPDYYRGPEKIRQAIALAPNVAKYHFQLGMEAFIRNQDNPDFALSYFDRAIELDPAYGSAYLYRGHLLYDLLNDPDAAFESYQKAQMLNSHDIQMYRNIGQIYEARGEIDNAIAVYQRGAETGMSGEILYEPRIKLLLEQRRYEEAEADAHILIENRYYIKPETEWFLLGQALEGQGRTDEAVEAYTQHIELAEAEPNPIAVEFVKEHS